jgi:hypothetical protein
MLCLGGQSMATLATLSRLNYVKVRPNEKIPRSKRSGRGSLEEQAG